MTMASGHGNAPTGDVKHDTPFDPCRCPEPADHRGSGPDRDTATGRHTAPATSSAAKSDITLAKFQKRREKAIMAADTDGDGKISLLEWEAFQAKRNVKGDPAKSFARIDSNHDGFIDRAELDALFAKRFARLDKNGDGILTGDEMPGHKSAPKPEQ
ncbi:acid-shock protein [Mesorhizobium sp. B2-4-13]|uniref:EF-hand domain-containing protein n=1 Tax=Mesorhizobium sp. B2-4-13 TaxID=2589936 RepID=UPI001FEECE98|nr:acid-shock protein [Mesorhizobium sp. B2-4-13]